MRALTSASLARWSPAASADAAPAASASRLATRVAPSPSDAPPTSGVGVGVVETFRRGFEPAAQRH